MTNATTSAPVSGASVLAYTAGTTTVRYSTATDSTGAYSLMVESDAYDFRFMGPGGLNTVVAKDVSVVSSLTLNQALTDVKYTFSGALTDQNGASLPNILVTLRNFYGDSYNGSTNASGGFSITVSPDFYAMGLSTNLTNNATGVGSFSLIQDRSHPTLDLTGGNLVRGLTLPIATVNFASYNAQGYPNVGTTVTVQTASTTVAPISLYPGDPGYTYGFGALTFPLHSSSQGKGSFKTIVGVTYTGAGISNGICNYTTGASNPDPSTLIGCNNTPLTVVNGANNVDVPKPPVAPHIFSGTVTDPNGTGLSSVFFTLRDAYNNSVTGSTDASGHFSLAVQPGLYSMQLLRSVSGFRVFLLQQDTANPTLDLTSGDLTQNLVVPLATVNFVLYNAQGYPSASKLVTAHARGNSSTPVSLYPGDPGYINIAADADNLTSNAQGAGSFQSIVGLVYTNSICGYDGTTISSPLIGCNTTPLTVASGSNTVHIPQTPAAPYTFSGALTDQQGNGFSGITITLRDAFNNVVTGGTGAGGAFSLTVQPGLYSMTLSGTITGLGFFTLQQQNTANPTLDLRNGNVMQNLILPLTTVNYAAYNAQGYPNISRTVQARITNFFLPLALYSGDPGYTVMTNISTFSNSQGTGSFKALVGVTYTGLSTVNGICTYDGNNQLIGCNTPAFTVVAGSNTIDVPRTPAAPYTFSGTLTDQNGNGLSGIAITLRDAFNNVRSVTTGSSGNFNLTLQPGLYSMVLTGTITGLGTFTLQQNTATPTIDLTNGNIVQNLQIPLATVDYTAYNAQGYRNISRFVRAQISNSFVSLALYPGDPGYTVSTLTSMLSGPQGTGSIKAIVGVTYTGASQSNGICTYASTTASNLIGCNITPLTVTSGSNYVDVPKAPAVPYTFSGILVTGDGTPIANATLSLQDAFSNIITIATSATGSFSLTVQPGVFSLRVVGSISGLGFTLQQNTSTPTIDLTSGSTVRNLVVPVATVDFMTLTTSSTPLANARVFYTTPTNTIYPVSLYTGDPGYLVTLSVPAIFSDAQARGSFKTLAGLTYGTTTNNGICENTSANVFVACISSSVTIVNGINNVVIPQAPATGPAAPTGLSAASPASSPVLSWQAVSGALFYRIYRDNSQIGSTSSLSFTDNNVAGGDHTYYIIAVNNIGGASGPSNTITVTVVLGPPTLPATFSILPSPMDTSQTATVSIPVLGNLYGFLGGEYFVGPDPGQGNGIAMTFTSGTLSAPIGGLLPANYTVSVRVHNGAGWSQPVSRTLNVATLPPTNLAAESPTHLVVLTWNSVAYASGYEIYRNGSKIGTSLTNTYTDLTAPIATNTYSVKALNPGGYPSNASNVISVTYAGPLHTVSGQVTFNGAAAAGVLVDTNTVNGPSGFSVTDGSGVYSIFNLDNSSYSVTVSNPLNTAVMAAYAPDYFTITSGNPFIVVNGGNVTQNLSFTASAITITVKNGQGALLSNALVSITNVTDGLFYDADGHVFNLSSGSLKSLGYTSSNGTVVRYVFPGATYRICASFPRLNSLSQISEPYCMPLTLTVSGDTSYEAVLPASYNVSGHVSFGGFSPPAGKTMVVISSSVGSIRQVVLTDANGNYVVDYLPDGAYDLQFVNNGSITASTIPQSWNFIKDDAITIQGANITQNLEFATNLVYVTVVDENGDAVASAFVYLRNKSTNLITTVDGTQIFDLDINTTVASGTTTAGQRTLAVFPGQLYEACVQVSTGTYCNPTYLFVNADASVIIVAAQTYVVSGMVSMNGSPLPGTGATLTMTSKYIESDTTDAAGAYMVNNLINGTYRTTLSYSGISYSSVATGLPDSFTLVSGQKYVTISGGNTTHNLSFNTYPVVVNVFDELNNLLAGSQILVTGSGSLLTSDGSMSFTVSSLEARAISITNGGAVLYLFPDATYTICATVNSGQYCAHGFTVSSTEVNIVNILTAAPNGLNVSPITPYPQNPVLAWNAVASAISYNVYRSDVLIGSSAITSFTDDSATEGVYAYQVQAVYAGDIAGALSASRSTIVDRTAPVLVSTNWINNPSLFNHTVPNVTVQLTDNLTDIITGEYFVGDTDPGVGQGIAMAAPGMTLTASFGWVEYPPGTYLINIRGMDAAGIWSNTATTSLVVQQPAPTNVTAEALTYLPPVISWSPVAGSQSYTVYRGSADIGSSLTTSFVDQGANPGTNVYSVVAISLLGIQSAHSEPVSVVYDPLPPTITADYHPEPSNGWNNSPVTLTFTCMSDFGIVICPDPITVTLDGADQAVIVTATDVLGGSTTMTFYVDLDQLAPIFGEPTLSEDLLHPGQTTVVTAPASDELSGVAGGEYFIGADPGVGNGVQMLWNGTNLSASFGSSLAPGIYTVSVRAMDVAGNWSGFDTVELTVILTAPTNLAAPSPTQSPALTWTGSEGAASYNIYRDSNLVGNVTSTSFNDSSAPDGTHAYYVTAADVNDNESGPSNTISVLVNTVPPTTTASLSPVPYAQDGTYPDPVTVTLSVTAVAGLSVTATYYTVDGGAQHTYATAFTVSGSGSHTITYWSVDNAGVVETPKLTTFTIHTNVSPAISPIANATLSEGSSFTRSGSFSDFDSGSWTATVNYGDGSGVQPLILSGTNFSLSHVYADDGTYTVTVTITDNQGASSTATATATVNNLPVVAGDVTGIPVDPIKLNASGIASVSGSITFTDPGILDAHTAVWDWGDGTTSAGVVTESNGAGTVTGSHNYTSPGVYTVTVTITDNGGLSTIKKFYYATVYDATSMFTAGIKFNSPAGALLANPAVTGSVNFSVHVKYNSSGQLVGTVSMDFVAGNIHFDATGFVYLVCTEFGMATLTGSGTLNGVSGYTFWVTGVDRREAGGNTIRFRVTDANNNVVYDTQYDPDNPYDITATPVTGVTAGTVIVT